VVEPAIIPVAIGMSWRVATQRITLSPHALRIGWRAGLSRERPSLRRNEGRWFQALMGDAPMSSAKPVLGCLVFLAAAVGFVISNHIVDAMIPSQNSRATNATARETTAGVQSESPSALSDTGDTNVESSTGRRCVDLNGHTFGWNWPNIPFGTTACSDAGRKTDK
jgi:hypothetical protein